jgi:hypothetical protein
MESINVVIDDETTTENLEDEVPHVKRGSKLACLIRFMHPLV